MAGARRALQTRALIPVASSRGAGAGGLWTGAVSTEGPVPSQPALPLGQASPSCSLCWETGVVFPRLCQWLLLAS